MSNYPRVLLTGFEAFAPYSINPTKSLVETFLPSAEIVLHKTVYQTDFEVVSKNYPKLLDEFRPDWIINLGLDARRGALCLETFAINTGFDPRGEKQHFPIEEFKNSAYHTNINTEKLATELCEAGIPSIRSNHAGTYLCNYIFYLSLKWATRHSAEALFIHMPFTTEIAADLTQKNKLIYPSIPANLSLQGIDLTISSLVESKKMVS